MTRVHRTSFCRAAIVLLAGACLASTQGPASSDNPPARGPDRLLLTLDGQPLTEADLQLLLLVRRIAADTLTDSLRQRLVQELLDERLIRKFLAERHVEPESSQLDQRVEKFQAAFARDGEDLGARLMALGFDSADLREALALPLAWQTYIARTVTPARVREFFAAHRFEFDGTQVRASHILITVAEDDPQRSADAARRKLEEIRQQILAGSSTFAEAASQLSDSPSRQGGGDLGFFPYRGKMPVSFTARVFPLQVGEISEPFQTSFGMHLATVTDRRPGDLSLEDVRPDVLRSISSELWRQTAADLRAKAKIDRPAP
jgi:parvulin-like peptidyl-prolyl isomerase